MWGPGLPRLRLDAGSAPEARTEKQAHERSMPKKRKKKIFSAAKVVREMARERVGSPKPSRLVPAKKTKPEKHKPTLGKLLADE
jgi:hypothetical protein